MFSKLFKHKDSVNDFLPSSLEIIETPPSPLGKRIIIIISCFIVVVLVWASFSKIDKVVVSTGIIVPIGGIKTVDSNIGGEIVDIMKAEGDKVKEGEAIIELDNVNSDDRESKLKEDLNLKRLDLEIINSKLENRNINYNEFNIKKNILEEIKLRESIDKKKKQKERDAFNKSILDVDDNINELNKENNELQTKYDEMSDVDKFLGGKEVLEQIERNKKQIIDLNERKNEMISENKLQIEELTLFQKREKNNKIKEIDDINKSLKNLEEEKENYIVKSPVDGTIFKINYNTIGSGVSQIKPIAEVVPDDTEYEIETFILNKDIARIEEGKEAVIKVESYDYQKHGTLTGKVKKISPNSTLDEVKGAVYKIKVEFNHKENPSIKILPGMNTIIEIKSEKIKVIDYFLDPFKKSIDNALKG